MIIIYWSTRAEENYDDILDYLEKSWPLRIKNKFATDVRSVIKGIERFPRMYPQFGDDKNLRKAVINPHVSLFYEIISDDEVELVCFWNNRRNPDDLPL